MKNLFKTTLLVLFSVILFSCSEDDNDNGTSIPHQAGTSFEVKNNDGISLEVKKNGEFNNPDNKQLYLGYKRTFENDYELTKLETTTKIYDLTPTTEYDIAIIYIDENNTQQVIDTDLDSSITMRDVLSFDNLNQYTNDSSFELGNEFRHDLDGLKVYLVNQEVQTDSILLNSVDITIEKITCNIPADFFEGKDETGSEKYIIGIELNNGKYYYPSEEIIIVNTKPYIDRVEVTSRTDATCSSYEGGTVSIKLFGRFMSYIDGHYTQNPKSFSTSTITVTRKSNSSSVVFPESHENYCTRYLRVWDDVDHDYESFHDYDEAFLSYIPATEEEILNGETYLIQVNFLDSEGQPSTTNEVEFTLE